MKRKITSEDLKKLNACPDQQRLFDRVFPDGAWITLDNVRKANEEGLDVGWLLREVLHGAKWSKHDRRDDSIWLKYWLDKIDSDTYTLESNKEIVRALKEDWSPRK